MVKKQFMTISSVQLTAILISTLIGVGVLAFPRLAVDAADTGAPLVGLLAGLICIVGMGPLILLHKRFPNDSIVGYSERLIGRWPGRAMTVLLIVMFIAMTALGAREFGKIVVSAILPQTPTSVTTFIMIALAALAARNNLTTFAYTHMFYLPLILGPVLLIGLLSMSNATWVYAMPILPPLSRSLLTGGLTLVTLNQGFFILSYALPAVQKKTRVWTASLIGLGTASAVSLLVALAPLSVFGAQELHQLMWPTLELAKATTIPGAILERLDAAFLTVWVSAVFTTLYSTYTVVVLSLSDLFHTEDHRIWSLAVLPIVFLAAMLPIDVASLYRLIEDVGRVGLIFTVLYPLALWVVALLRPKVHARPGT